MTEKPADSWLEPKLLTGSVVEGPGEAGRVASRVGVGGTLEGTALPISLQRLVGYTQRSVVPVDNRILLRAPLII